MKALTRRALLAQIDALTKERDALRAENGRLREDLAEYGWHTARCASCCGRACDCGFYAAVAAAPGKKETP